MDGKESVETDKTPKNLQAILSARIGQIEVPNFTSPPPTGTVMKISLPSARGLPLAEMV